MALVDFKCDSCGFTDDYFIGSTISEDQKPPMICPKCNNGNFEKQFSATGGSFKINGYCYKNEYSGKGSTYKNDPILAGANRLMDY
jgi:putative FmdB family regulatory protein